MSCTAARRFLPLNKRRTLRQQRRRARRVLLRMQARVRLLSVEQREKRAYARALALQYSDI